MSKSPEDRNAAPPTARAYSTARGWWLVTALFITAFVSYANRLVLGVLVDPLRSAFGVSDSAVSLLQGPAFSLIYVFATLPLGRLVDQYNRKALITLGATVWAIGAVCCGLAPGFSTLLAARVLIGVSEATLIPAAVSMIADGFPAERRGTALGVFAMATALGGPLGITLGGMLLSMASKGAFAHWPLIATLAPWRLVLVLFGLAGLIAPALLLTVREPGRFGTVAKSDSKAAVEFFVSSRHSLLPLFIGMGLLSIGDYGLVSWAPSVLSRRFDWRPDQLGLAFGLITATAAVLGSLCGGTLSDLAERRKGLSGRFKLGIVAAPVAMCGALAASAPSPVWVLAGVGLWVLASTIGGIGGIAALQSAVPNQFRGTSASLLTFCNTLLGYGCGPSLVAFTTEAVFRKPDAVGFAITAVVAPAALIAAWMFLRAYLSFSQTLLRSTTDHVSNTIGQRQ